MLVASESVILESTALVPRLSGELWSTVQIVNDLADLCFSGDIESLHSLLIKYLHYSTVKILPPRHLPWQHVLNHVLYRMMLPSITKISYLRRQTATAPRK